MFVCSEFQLALAVHHLSQRLGMDVAQLIFREYKVVAGIGNMLYPEVYEQQNGVTIVLADEQKVPYAIMQFRGK